MDAYTFQRQAGDEVLCRHARAGRPYRSRSAPSTRWVTARKCESSWPPGHRGVIEIPDPSVDALGYKACCATLYESDAIRYLLGDAMRPGDSR